METTRKHVVDDKLSLAPFFKTEVLSGRKENPESFKKRKNKCEMGMETDQDRRQEDGEEEEED